MAAALGGHLPPVIVTDMWGYLYWEILGPSAVILLQPCLWLRHSSARLVTLGHTLLGALPWLASVDCV